ncbi:hypothetical protein GQ457_14G020890 [Hibiscus cannabinus]
MKYANDILKKFKMQNCKPRKVDAKEYRSIVGSQLYLTATRPYLMFAASLLSRFMTEPSDVHMGVVRRCFHGFQRSKKLWLNPRLKLSTLQHQEEATKVLVHNKSAIDISENPVCFSKTKHMKIKSVLSSLPSYYLSLFEISKTVLLKVEKIRGQFLWGYTKDIKILVRVSWSRVYFPRVKGGAGVVNLQAKNKALFAKKLIEDKYGASPLRSYLNSSFPRKMLVVWRGIANNWKNPNVSSWMSTKAFRWQLGDGRTTLFWEDMWCGEKPFRVVFNRLYRLAWNKGVVSEMDGQYGLQDVIWELQFSRNLLDREKQMVLALEMALNKWLVDFRERVLSYRDGR